MRRSETGHAIGRLVIYIGVLAAAAAAALTLHAASIQADWVDRTAGLLVDQSSTIRRNVITCGRIYPKGLNTDSSSPDDMKKFPASSARLVDAACPGAPGELTRLWSGRDGSFLTLLPSGYGTWTYINDSQGLRASLPTLNARAAEAAAAAAARLGPSAVLVGKNLRLTIASRAEAAAIPGATESAKPSPAVNDGTLEWDRANYDFGVRQLNQTWQMNVVLRNRGSQASGQIDYSAPTGYSVTGCSSVPAGGSCGVQINFHPTEGVTYAGSAVATSGRAQTTMALSGSGFVGTVTLQFDRSSFNFNNVQVGQTSQMNIVLRNPGTAPSGAIAFASTNGFSATGCETGVQAGGSCGVLLKFTPSSKGTFASTVTASSARSFSSMSVSGAGT